MAGTVDLALADATLVGERNGDLLLQASDAGDVDADGHGDLLLGAYGNDEGGPAAGAAYLVLGPVTGTFDLSLANAKLLGETANDWAGADVSGAGDVDSDGHDDILVGAPASYSAGSWAGAAYLVLGPVTGTLDLSLADAKLLGELDHWTGEALSSAGDVDGDGHDDLLVGTWWDSAALVLGPVTGTLDLARADLKLVGEEIDDACCNVADAGDVDADGRADILLSDPGNDHGGDRAGAAYLLYGAGLF
jgi:hypothetical protein